MEFIKKNRLYIALAGCALMLVGSFLPFAKVTVSIFGYSASDSVKFIEGDGKIVLIAAIVAAVLIWFKKEKISLIATGIALFTTLYDLIDLKSKFGSGYSSLAKVTTGLSPWIIIIGAILAAGVVVLQILEEKGKIK